jgi:hypothetical protein
MYRVPTHVHNHALRSLKQLYGLAYQCALQAEAHHDEAHRQVSVITNYLDFVWKRTPKKAPYRRSPSPTSL